MLVCISGTEQLPASVLSGQRLKQTENKLRKVVPCHVCQRRSAGRGRHCD